MVGTPPAWMAHRRTGKRRRQLNEHNAVYCRVGDGFETTGAAAAKT